MSKKILFTGGGSAGHVTLNLTLIPIFQKNKWEVSYIGSENGIERDIISKLDKVKYYPIKTGKLRRYFSWKNFSDMLNVPKGIVQAYKIIKKENPDIIFSKGGFVSFPVVLSGWLNKKKVLMHESDMTPGLANKMSLPFVSKLFTTFEETQNYISELFNQKSKVEYIAPVVSDRLKDGNPENAITICNLKKEKPIIMIIGGSLGAKSINNAVRRNLDKLLPKYQIIHICGKGQLDPSQNLQGYKQFEYVDKELKDFMASADIVISRAGSNSIFELLNLKKTMILIPLPSTSSRGEQSLNAAVFQRKGYCEVIKDEDLGDNINFLKTIDSVYKNKSTYISNMERCKMKSIDNNQLYEMISKVIFNQVHKGR